MKKLINFLIVVSCIIGLSTSLNAQTVIGSQETYKTLSSAYNWGYINKERTNPKYFPFIESIDSIKWGSNSVNNGDSIPLLIGDVPAAIEYIVVRIDTGASSTAYSTVGSTDTTFIYSRYYGNNVPIAMLADTIFSTTLGGYTSTPISTNFTESDSCLFWLKIPNPKYASGTHLYTLFFKYIKLGL